MQHNLKKQFIQAVKVVLVGLVLGLGIGFVYADWTPPQAPAPGCTTGNSGCDAPIDTSSGTQSKSGILNLTFDQNINPALTITKGATIGTLSSLLGGTGVGVVGLNEWSNNIPSWTPSPSVGAGLIAIAGNNSGGIYSLGNLNILGNIIAGSSGSSNTSLASNFYMPVDIAPTMNNINGTPLAIDLTGNTGSNVSNAINLIASTSSNNNTVGFQQNVPNFSFSNYGGGGGVNIEASKVQLQDGTQGVNKVLTSDPNGLSSWQALSTPLPDQYETITADVTTKGANESINGGAMGNFGLQTGINTFTCPTDYPIMIAPGGNCETGGSISTLFVSNIGGLSTNPGSMYLECHGGTHDGDKVGDIQAAQYVCGQSNTIEVAQPGWTAATGQGTNNESCVTWLNNISGNVASDANVGVFTDNTCQYEIPGGSNSCLYEDLNTNKTTGTTSTYDVVFDGNAVSNVVQNSGGSTSNTIQNITPEAQLSQNDSSTMNPPIPSTATTCYN